MNIYFACSITGGRTDETAYQAIVKTLLADGHEVPTAHLAESGVIFLEEVVEAVEVYTRDIAWIAASDALIAEVSTPSHGVGYEVSYALSIGKPVLCCYQEGVKVSKMILGNTYPTLKIASYGSDGEAAEQVRRFLAELS
ncbi:MAG TPA: nucleoside 2-deoxyribosyltransferase [Anaerolineales bacterium]|nr:nucleoside 2-deoxyribosyltransferase [Anaerolineales bacterium]